VTKARRGRKRSTRPTPEVSPGGREHWRADGAPKARFTSSDDANRASLQFRLEEGADLDPYRCSYCSGWHLGTHRD